MTLIPKTVAREQAGKGARPGIGGVGVGARDRQRLRDVDVEFVRRRELAVGVTGAAAVAEIGEIVQVAVGKRTAHFHRRKHRAKAFAIAAGIAARHQPVGFLEGKSCSAHVRFLPSHQGASWAAPCFEPFLDQVGDLRIVLVHHQHVRVALDAGLGRSMTSTLPPAP